MTIESFGLCGSDTPRLAAGLFIPHCGFGRLALDHDVTRMRAA
jgi:hypothetical protein